jgi:hypothetical protein
VRIAYKDRAYIHQSAGIPNLPTADEAPMVVTMEHVRANVSGSEMYRVPMLQDLVKRGHEVVFLERRDIMPSEELDFDLQRLAAYDPKFAPLVLDRDPMLDIETWDVRAQMNFDVVEEFYKLRDEKGMKSTDWYIEQFKKRRWEEPPDADIMVMNPTRTQIVSGMNQSYAMGCYLERGTPVVLFDCDRNLSGTVASLKAMGFSWPHPLVTLMSPYVIPTSWGPTELLDFPYRPWQEQDPLPVGRKNGLCFVGNDYDRRKKMENLLLCHPDIPTTVWGKFKNNRKDKTKLSGYKGDVEAWCAEFPHVGWSGRIPNNRVPMAMNLALATVNIVRKDYEQIGLVTLRTTESPMYGTLQIADGDIHRIEEFVPKEFLARSKRDVRAIYDRIRDYDDDEYSEALKKQRNMLRDRLDFGQYFMPRFMEIIEDAVDRAERFHRQHGINKNGLVAPDLMQPARR